MIRLLLFATAVSTVFLTITWQQSHRQHPVLNRQMAGMEQAPMLEEETRFEEDDDAASTAYWREE